jgi:flavodoxin/ferredoxin
MNVTIIFFSQTGHTRSVARAMAEAIREKGHTARTVPLRKATPQDATIGDVLAVGTPCFSSQAPTPVKAFLRTLPPLDGKRAFVFATSGGAPGRVLYDLTRLLRRKGAGVIGGFLTRGELLHPAPCLTGRMPQRPNADDLADARRFAAEAIDHIAAGRPGPMVVSRPDALRPGWGFYDIVALLSTDGFLCLLLPEPKPDPARCNRCQWCVLNCPTHNITLAPDPVLGRECIRCYRCLTGCPQQAFDADWTLGNLAVLAFYNTTFERWFGDLKPGERLYADG